MSTNHPSRPLVTEKPALASNGYLMAGIGLALGAAGILAGVVEENLGHRGRRSADARIVRR